MASENTRTRLLAAARQLFALHSFAGTSLQMIADRLGVTKAAVYHHFKTRDDILDAVIEPALAEMRAIIDDAEAQRGHAARAEHMIAGFVELTVRHRDLITLLSSDPGVLHALGERDSFADLLTRPLYVLTRDPEDPAERIRASMALSAIATTASSPMLTDVDDATMRETLTDTGRRILGLRRRTAH
ncbi:TetR/AcrR family transcriptional regulator [Phytomonospora endophytica]|uniref:AcrR family transcriptional regulator n=1 Tax=Phytomonospora endophytica TaxID=714109 RepID=A0A841FIN7_9ACTN|nr:TetR/AcrR family transcriptional regulator [Phytomonospora endophytica]MBB6035645.1 AcrR family transcriptional regulator [Phytomonospora endophytica]GIG69992.1 TetR family transcriptional regulator [Phytomonospora endophytica]